VTDAVRAIAALSSLLGEENVHTDDESRSRFLASWCPVISKERQRGELETLLPLAVVLPGNTEEVAALVRLANAQGTPLRPVGGASNTVGSGGAAPIAVDLARLQSVRWDEESLLVHAGAGCGLGDLEEQLNRHDYTLGHLPQSARLATVGGAIATNAVGIFSGRYGRQADLTAAIEAVLPTGEVIRVGGDAPGAAAYFDLRGLLLGTEGAFGIVTGATLQMRPVPDVRAWCIFRFNTLSDGVDAMRLVYRSDSRPAAARLFDRAAAPSLPGKPEAVLLLGFEGDELAQTGPYQLAYAVCEKVGGTAVPPEVGDTWFEEQRQNTGWLSPNARSGGLADVLAVSVPWSQVKAVYNAMHRAMSPLVTQLRGQFAHATSNGAALEFFFEAQAEPGSPEAALDLYERIVDTGLSACQNAGGSVAHHYGVGRTRAEAFIRERGPEQMNALHLIKCALDPNGILPPLPGSSST
jgi:alkyldihydroxyacetonephosphate synthase